MHRCWKSAVSEPWKTSQGGHNQNKKLATFQYHRTPGAANPKCVSSFSSDVWCHYGSIAENSPQQRWGSVYAVWYIHFFDSHTAIWVITHCKGECLPTKPLNTLLNSLTQSTESVDHTESRCLDASVWFQVPFKFSYILLAQSLISFCVLQKSTRLKPRHPTLA